MTRVLVALVAATAPMLGLAQATTWDLDPAHSHTSFTIRHMVITNVRGEFQKVSGTVKLDEKDVTKSTVEATIDATSIDSRVPDRDKHLRSADFFDVEKFPTITFKSTKVQKAGKGLKVTGDLTMHGVTKPVVLDVEGPTAAIKDPWGKTRRGLAASTTIDRRDFGLTWGKMVEAGPVVGDKVKIEIESEIVQQAEGKTAAK